MQISRTPMGTFQTSICLDTPEQSYIIFHFKNFIQLRSDQVRYWCSR